jgi:hypothetical protein
MPRRCAWGEKDVVGHYLQGNQGAIEFCNANFNQFLDACHNFSPVEDRAPVLRE